MTRKLNPNHLVACFPAVHESGRLAPKVDGAAFDWLMTRTEPI